MKVEVAAATDIGLVRDHNEDAYLVQDPLYVVADGMGGHLGGEVASATALATMAHVVTDAGIDALADAVRQANRAVFDRQAADVEVAGMGTTLTAVALDGSQLHVAHVGDSRGYLLRDGKLRLLTQDHSLVGEMVREGSLTEAQARVHPRRSTLTRALGISGDIEVDSFEVPVRAGDRILLCTDGLSGMIEDRRLREILKRGTSVPEVCATLIAEANANGGVDNVTAVIIDLLAEEGDGPGPEGTGVSSAGPALPPERRGWPGWFKHRLRKQ
jgi:protein phosphatase